MHSEGVPYSKNEVFRPQRGTNPPRFCPGIRHCEQREAIHAGSSASLSPKGSALKIPIMPHGFEMPNGISFLTSLLQAVGEAIHFQATLRLCLHRTLTWPFRNVRFAVRHSPPLNLFSPKPLFFVKLLIIKKGLVILYATNISEILLSENMLFSVMHILFTNIYIKYSIKFPL